MGRSVKLHELVYKFTHVLPQTSFNTVYDEFSPQYNNWFYKTEFQSNDPRIHQHPRRLGLAKPNGVKPSLGWSLPIIDAGVHLQLIANHTLQQQLSLFRINSNIQFFGQESTFHTDGPLHTWSFLLFMNQSWNTEWGGNFILRLNQEDYISVIPSPNTGILFPAHLYHKGDAPNRLAMIPRLSIAYTYK